MDTYQIENNHLIPLYKKRDISLERAEGCAIYDADGKEYLDLTSQYGAAVLGYNHPQFKQALHEQLDNIHLCHNSFYNSTRAEFIRSLSEAVNIEGVSNLQRVFLSSTGTESVEAALKFARCATGKTDFVAFKRAYHGRTMGALSATASPKYKKLFQPLIDGFTHCSFNDIDQVKEAISENTAAIIIEPIQGEGGVYPVDLDFLTQLRQLCDENETLLIFDEIQTGMGRTGAVCAWHHYNVAPDILCLSKGIGNGIPLAATMVTEAISEKIQPGTHGTTFGGNPFSAAAGISVLQELQSEGFLEEVQQKGNFFRTQLEALDHSKIREIRGKGLMIAIELREKVGLYMKALQEAGFLVLGGGTTIRVLPPLIISEEEITTFVRTFQNILQNSNVKSQSSKLKLKC